MFNYQNYINERVQYHKELNPLFWDNYQFNEKVRQKLLTIAYEFFDQVKLKCPILDVILIGSLVNFNYTDSSDLDVHIIVDLSVYNDDMEIVKEYVKDRKTLWNLKHDIKIKGYEVELYIEDISDPRASLGQFSLLKDEWIIKPQRQSFRIDNFYVKDKYGTYISGILMLEDMSEKNMSPERAKEFYKISKILIDKLVKMRKTGLSKVGEFSAENIVWKKLKHNGWVEKLFKTVDKFYDKIYTQ